jgi:hypothetical protein
MTDFYMLTEQGQRVYLEDMSGYVLLETDGSVAAAWTDVSRETDGTWTDVERAT